MTACILFNVASYKMLTRDAEPRHSADEIERGTEDLKTNE